MGKVLKAKGLDGTVKCGFAKNSSSEIKEIKKIFVGGQEYKVLRAYGADGFAFFKLAGIDSVEAAAGLIGETVEIERESGSKLKTGEFYIADLINAECIIHNSELIGVVTDIQNYGGGELLSIATKQGEILVPFINGLIKEFDAKNKRVVFDKKVFSEVCDFVEN